MGGRLLHTLALLSFFPLLPLEAENGSVVPIDIGRAVDSALHRDPDLRQMRSELQVLRKRMHPLFRRRLPVLTLGYGGEENYSLTSSYSLEHTLTAGLEWTILDGGGTAREAASLGIRYGDLQHRIDRRKTELTDRILRQGIDILRLHRELGLIEDMEKLLDLRFRAAETLDSGLHLTPLEEEELRLEYRRLHLSRQEIIAGIEAGKNRFSLMISRDPGGHYSPEGSIVRNPVSLLETEIPSSLSFFREQAALHNYEVESALRTLEQLRLDLPSGAGRHIPEAAVYTRAHVSGQAFPLHLPAFTVGVRISSSDSLWSLELGEEHYHSRLEYQGDVSALLRVDLGVLFEGKRKEEEIRLCHAAEYLTEARRYAAVEAEVFYREVLLLEENHRLSTEESELAEAKLELVEKKHELGRVSTKNLLEAAAEANRLRMAVYDLSAQRCIQELHLFAHCGLTSQLIPLLSRYIEGVER